MAASRTVSSEPAAQEVFSWLRNLPLAPEYHPTVAEFQDPIAYIFKIEKEASSYGICKIVPPVPPAPKKSVVSNFNRSLAARSTESNPTFTTRQQQVGFCPRKPCPVKKPVWQSGENYTFQDFETKARAFEKNYLKKCSKKSNPSALEIETLYWKATVDKPISVEYANDMPGSAFTPLSSRKGKRETGEGQGNVGDSNWNMRGVSRWAGSLLKFMKEEIPGVTSPMVYVAMLFSWFAWHVEDHDLHSLNYMHLGAGKTWYGVPRDAAVAFEEVARVHGYGGEVNPLVTFAILGEKTTVISPEVLVEAGVPCCRLVQNAGEFVVTFPRAYHSGFSHGFNCGEAANIATPEWLKFAKDAAIRRASINYPPMVSHFQLLYDLTLALCSRVPTTINLVPRSSRLKDKKKSEGESMIKEEFLHDVIQNNNLLHTLCKGSTSWVVLLPQNSSEISSSCQNLQLGANSRLALGLCNPTDEDIKSPERINNLLQGGSSYSMKKKFSSLCERRVSISSYCGNGVDDPQEHNVEDKTTAHLGDMLSDQRLFSCVTCGILTFSCAAILNPKAPAARYLGSADCSLLKDWTARSIERFDDKSLDSGLRHFGDCNIESPDPRDQITSSCVQEDKGSSALGLIGLNYGDSSDSEQDDETEHIENKASVYDDLNERSCQNLYSSARFETNATRFGSVGALKPKDTLYVPQIYNEESSRPHVFCLEHAIEVEKQLQPIGGAEIFLICHPDYPKIEAEAKSIAEEIGDDYGWNEIAFRSANKEDKERIRAALDSDDATPNSGDWTVKLGANLFYSVRLGWSSLYSKQMPYNPVIHKAFGRRTRTDDAEDEEYGRRSRKKVVEGKWCGKVWMSNQIHPILAHKYNKEEDEIHEEDERYYLHSSDEKPARGKSGNTSSVTKKKKRKMAAKSSLSLKKRRTSLCKEEEEEAVSDEDVKSIENNIDSDNSLEENYRRRGRIYGGSNSNNTKAAEFTPVEDVMNSDVSQSGDSEPLRREFSDEESAPPPKIYSRRKKLPPRTDDLTVVSDENSRRPWNLRNKKPKQDLRSPDNEMMSPSLNPGLTKGRISLPVRQRTPRIASKNVAALRLERQFSGFVEEEVEEKEEEEEEECRGPSTRLRTKKLVGPAKGSGPGKQQAVPRKKSTVSSKKKVATAGSSKPKVEEGEYGCEIEGCGMRFRLKQELTLHMKNICPVKGCGKKFFSHKYLVQHRRVHDDDRPLKCPWKGCKMTFKWAWARTEHIRVHTGVRPYVCGEAGCGQTFRFVSDFSRHKRKTGHSIKVKG